jgi:hypothetical protein
MPGPCGAGWVGDGGGSNGAAVTGPIPNSNVDVATPAAIAAALATRLRSIIFRSLRGFVCSTCWSAATQLTLKPTPQRRAARENSIGQLGADGGAAGTGHCGRYPGIPPPPRGLPPPLRPYLQHFSAGMPGGGPTGSVWKAGAAGGGSNGAAVTSPTPLVSADIPTPAAIAAAAVKRFRFIVRMPPQTFTTLVTSCLVGYAENHRRRTPCHRLPLPNRYKAQFYI